MHFPLSLKGHTIRRLAKTELLIECKLTGTNKYGHKSLILLPALTILCLAPLNIPIRAVDNHAGEEYRIEPREGAIKPQ